jgi:hypothetical protein
MHIVHSDRVLTRVRSLGFARKYEWTAAFPHYLQQPMPPTCYQRVTRSALANGAYFVRDVWVNGPLTDSVVKAARTLSGWLTGTAAKPPAGAQL